MIALVQGGSQKKFPGWGLKLEGLKLLFHECAPKARAKKVGNFKGLIENDGISMEKFVCVVNRRRRREKLKAL